MDGGSGFACDDGPASHLPPTFTLLIPIKTYNTYKWVLARMKRIGNWEWWGSGVLLVYG